MTSTKEYYDEHVAGKNIDWNELVEQSSVVSEETLYDRALGAGNLLKWSWKNLDGYIPSHLAKQIREKGIYFSSTPDLVNPYTGHRLGIKLTQNDNPYYMVVSNHGKDPAYYATTCPEEYVAIMKIYSNSFVEKTGDYKKWQDRRDSYNKKYPLNRF